VSTLSLPNSKKRLTHLQRAYKVFERMQPQLFSARSLAAVMAIDVTTAYNYIKRLKALHCIEQQGGSGKIPLYGLRAGATMPADDSRGRKPRHLLARVLEPIVSGGSFDLELGPAAMFASGKEGQ
jgi:hypothetical protein